MLPVSAANGISTPFIDCLFVSTSATCVTGLVTVDTGTHWSYFGKTVIMFLIEIGGLGLHVLCNIVCAYIRKEDNPEGEAYPAGVHECNRAAGAGEASKISAYVYPSLFRW